MLVLGNAEKSNSIQNIYEQEQKLSIYRRWSIDKNSYSNESSLDIVSRKIEELDLVKCQCGQFSGYRDDKTINEDSERFIGLQILEKGRETFKTRHDEKTFLEGSMILWNSSIPSEFHVESPIAKSTLMIPEKEISSRVNLNKLDGYKFIDTDNALSRIIYAYMKSLSENFYTVNNVESFALKRAVLELACSLIESQNDSMTDTRLSRNYLNNIMKFVRDNIQDPDLNVAKIAQENRISVRYLHLIFNEINSTPYAWIQNERLNKCREDLKNPIYEHKQISEICFKWGFNDASHFSRCFKKKFGISPRQLKQKRI
ncbi:helix-turn-helix domain-containing protein [Neptuniibacter sp. CAU 1671]|uniref:helix-turn-helix domain-containing protein n=1 Tax=Neptuniibacter sp. CAU 1671 TaxID=3032593 RepID=UPI0023DCDE26|nr:helix-turn-helix domain-containing protein [Neptuniibacter sp. CAU 1671]MDF2180576.1 helix-turn-helix domain-containing protein [Neptuniibacter sp. CAU 1671]